MNRKIFLAVPFALISLVAGILGGLVRLGIQLPLTEPAVSHGGLMVGSFLGTVISLERVAVVKKNWLYIVPVISGISIIPFFMGKPDLSWWFLCTAAVGLIFMYVLILRRHSENYIVMMMIGAICWFYGNATMLLHMGFPTATGWWMLFLLLTIGGERLELGKFMPGRKYKNESLWILIIALILSSLFIHSVMVFGIIYVLIGLWFLQFDIARISMKKSGLNRYVGILLMTGYLWLTLTGLLMIVPALPGFTRDAILHAFFIGFTFNMIFAHGPLIFPGVAGLSVRPYHPVLYIWLILLQISLAGRVFGDILLLHDLRQFSGLINGITIIGYFITLAILIIKASGKKTTISD